ncbi:SDR family NAD(P)-dependent oxidoreductase [Celerinatantimonas sp. YJH-8]|uniref:SDR family NAD(P)-dependent oxidoreductase n=1 Tax=Celerinatantimonas sp. YJH-8 TaxID=3228714 RepID=UPI0038BF15AF
MSRILITGSSDGLGLLTAQHLIKQGHQVVLHARNSQRAEETQARIQGAWAMVTGDLSNMAQTRGLAEQVNRLGTMDAVIYNAGIYGTPQQQTTEDGLNSIFAVNVLAPYILSVLLNRPQRLIFLSSSMHYGARHDVQDINWEKRAWNNTAAYSESKLYDTMLACAIARLWPQVYSNSVDPGWVPTRMGGPSAPDDLQLGCETQAWLAVADEAAAHVSGQYFHHMQPRDPDRAVLDPNNQQRLLDFCAKVSGLSAE